MRVQNHWSPRLLLPWSFQCVWFHRHYAECHWLDPWKSAPVFRLAHPPPRRSCVPYLPCASCHQSGPWHSSVNDYADGVDSGPAQHCRVIVFGHGDFLDFGHVIIYACETTGCTEQYGQFWDVPKCNVASIPTDDICWLERCTGPIDEWGNTTDEEVIISTWVINCVIPLLYTEVHYWELIIIISAWLYGEENNGRRWRGWHGWLWQ